MTWGRLEDQRGVLASPGLRSGPTIAGRPHQVGDLYSVLRDAAVEAATRNNAAIWFVERDRSNIFVNSDGSGGTPSNGGVIGLVLPNRGLRGPELFLGGDGTALGVWTLTGGTISLSDGVFQLTTSGAFGGASRVITTIPGRWYEVRATFRNGSSDPATVFVRPNGADATTDQVQLFSNTSGLFVTSVRYFRATTNQVFIRLTSLRNGAGDTAFFTSLSFREVIGFPLESPTTSQKPTLIQPGGANPNRIGFRFDGTDDRLRSIRSPLSATPGDPYTMIFSGQLSTLTGPRMAVSDGRGLGMNGNSTSATAEVLHGGTARYAFPTNWPLNSRRVVTSQWSGASSVMLQRVSGSLVGSGEGWPQATSQVTPEMFIGARSGTQEFWQGDIFLACACPGSMPLPDMQTIERFAAFIGDAPYV